MKPQQLTLFDSLGPPKGESNYEEAPEFDPIVYHNQFCPWVNGNVAAAGCGSSNPSTGTDTFALCGWQLTLDALDAFRSLGLNAIQTVASESAASLYKVCYSTRISCFLFISLPLCNLCLSKCFLII